MPTVAKFVNYGISMFSPPLLLSSLLPLSPLPFFLLFGLPSLPFLLFLLIQCLSCPFLVLLTLFLLPLAVLLCLLTLPLSRTGRLRIAWCSRETPKIYIMVRLDWYSQVKYIPVCIVWLVAAPNYWGAYHECRRFIQKREEQELTRCEIVLSRVADFVNLSFEAFSPRRPFGVIFTAVTRVPAVTRIAEVHRVRHSS